MGDVLLNFTEPSGESDWVLFGETPDANDGSPPDDYDTPKPPPAPPDPPYIRAWFDDNLTQPPYCELGKDYREYPDYYKVWNLIVHWENDSFDYIPDITISWNGEGETGGWTGNYEIKVKAKDENELESNWSDLLPVTMPKLYNEKAVDISNNVVYDEDTSHNLFSHRVGRSIGEFIDFILRIFERQNEKLFKFIKQQFYLNLKVNRIA